MATVNAPDAPDLLPGTAVRVGRREYVVPALSLNGLKAVERLLPALEGKTVEGTTFVDAVATIVHLAIARNYPDVTREQLEDEIDIANLPALVGAVLGAAAPLVPKLTPAEPVTLQD